MGLHVRSARRCSSSPPWCGWRWCSPTVPTVATRRGTLGSDLVHPVLVAVPDPGHDHADDRGRGRARAVRPAVATVLHRRPGRADRAARLRGSPGSSSTPSTRSTSSIPATSSPRSRVGSWRASPRPRSGRPAWRGCCSATGDRWLVVGSIILGRLFFGPRLPEALVPTLAIEVAPGAVASLAWFALNGGTDRHRRTPPGRLRRPDGRSPRCACCPSSCGCGSPAPSGPSPSPGRPSPRWPCTGSGRPRPPGADLRRRAGARRGHAAGRRHRGAHGGGAVPGHVLPARRRPRSTACSPHGGEPHEREAATWSCTGRTTWAAAPPAGR